MNIALTVLDSPSDPRIEHVRQFFRDFAGWLGRDLAWQGMDREMAELPRPYAGPGGRLILAERDGCPVGCVGVRRYSLGVCEIKRLYVEPGQRGHGVGRALALGAIDAAREMGYRRALVDTLPAMRIAMKLYRELGFRDAPTYFPAPAEGALILALDLQDRESGRPANENLDHLFDWNRAWAQQMREVDADYFRKLALAQTPDYLWIGCSDSRVPSEQIAGLLPGEVFVHRNVANLVMHTDINCLSVIQYAVDVLRVRHVMVVGHYGCGGVKAALERARVGLVDLWLRHVVDVYHKHAETLDALAPDRRHDRLCELNVLEQAANVARNTVVQDAWVRGQPLTVHGWIYSLEDGLLRDLGFTASAPGDLVPRYREALAALEG